MRELARRGVAVGTCMMPILPFIEDNPENIRAIVEQTAAHGGTFVIPWFGMSMRDRQRVYYYEQLDRHFPGMREKYERRFGEHYECPANYAADLARQFYQWCAELGIGSKVKRYQPAQQLSLF